MNVVGTTPVVHVQDINTNNNFHELDNMISVRQVDPRVVDEQEQQQSVDEQQDDQSAENNNINQEELQEQDHDEQQDQFLKTEQSAENNNTNQEQDNEPRSSINNVETCCSCFENLNDLEEKGITAIRTCGQGNVSGVCHITCSKCMQGHIKSNHKFGCTSNVGNRNIMSGMFIKCPICRRDISNNQDVRPMLRNQVFEMNVEEQRRRSLYTRPSLFGLNQGGISPADINTGRHALPRPLGFINLAHDPERAQELYEQFRARHGFFLKV